MLCRHSAPFKRVSYKVGYEDVSTDAIEFTEDAAWQPIALSFVLGVGSLVFFFIAFTSDLEGARTGARVMGSLLVAAALFAWQAAQWARRDLLQLSGGDPALVLFGERNGSSEVSTFLSALRERRDDYLRRTYGSAGPRGTKLDLLERLFSLKQAGALSDVEYEDLKSEILGSGDRDGASGQYL